MSNLAGERTHWLIGLLTAVAILATALLPTVGIVIVMNAMADLNAG